MILFHPITTQVVNIFGSQEAHNAMARTVSTQ